jgi:hypothetical protein
MRWSAWQRRSDCRGHRPRLQFVQAFDDFLHAANHQRKPVVIEFVGRVVGGMIIRITEGRSVRDHDAGIAVLPE